MLYVCKYKQNDIYLCFIFQNSQYKILFYGYSV